MDASVKVSNDFVMSFILRMWEGMTISVYIWPSDSVISKLLISTKFSFAVHNDYITISKFCLLSLLLNLWSKMTSFIDLSKSSHQRCSIKKIFLKISLNSQENIFAGAYLIKKEIFDTGVFLCKNFKNTFLTEHLWAIDSV